MRKMLTLLAAVLALSAMAGIAGAYEMRTPGGIIGSFLYTKWFFSPQQSTSQHLIFRMFGHEGGLARNLFVLNCKKDKDDPAYVEMILPARTGVLEAIRCKPPRRRSGRGAVAPRQGFR